MSRFACLVLLFALGAGGQASFAGTLYVARRSWHVDVGFSVDELTPPLRQVAEQFPHARYLFFGFGDRRYLLARHQGSGNLSGALWPGAGLILVTALDGSPEQAFGGLHVARLEIGDGEQRNIEENIAKAFSGAERGLPFIQPGPYEESLYIEARPRYSVFHTCNTWAAEILHSGGLPISARGVIFAGQLWPRVRRLQARLAPAD